MTADAPPIRCNGGFCILAVAPGIELDVAQGDFVEWPGGEIVVEGDVEIHTPVGGVGLADARLVVEPGLGMSGSSLSPDYSIGELAGSPSTLLPGRVDVTTAPGREIDLEIPLYDDVHYVVFSDEGGLNAEVETGIGSLRWAIGPQSWRLVLDPVDPFLYVGSDIALPVFTGELDVQDLGRGYGVSLSGRIPFAPPVPRAIEEVLPAIQGDTITYGSVDVTPFLPILDTRFEGVVITDEDPDGNGAWIFGADAASARDRIRVVDGTVTSNIVIPLLPSLTFDLEIGLEPEPVAFTLITSQTGVGTAREKREAWLSPDLHDVAPVNRAANGWLEMPSEIQASVFYFGPGEDDDYFLAATDRAVSVDARRMAAYHGVDANALLVSESVVQIDAQAIRLTSESFLSSIHPDVVFTRESRTQLVLPTSDESAFDLLIETESEIGGVSLSQYGQHLTIDAFRHWGRYETPNYGYGLEGAFSDQGAWLEGTANARLPYRYPAVDLAADVAGRIAATEQAEAFAQADLDVNLDALIEYQSLLNEESARLGSARSALSSARSWLSSQRAELSRVRNYDCGTCKWYDAICWAEVGACEAWRLGAIPTLEKAVELAQAGVSAAEATLNRVQRAYDEASLLVDGAQRAVDLARAARDEARLALIVLRAERAALPLEDGTIDATVRLRLTRDGLTGSVSGRFEGADFGEGVVVQDDAGARACFVVPQAGEALCAAL